MPCLKRPCLGHLSSGVTTDGSTRKIYAHQTEAKRLILQNSVESAYQGNMTLSQDLDPFSETYHGYPMQVPDAKCRCVSGFPDFRCRCLLAYGCVSKPIIINVSGVNTHLPAILMFTRATRF